MKLLFIGIFVSVSTFKLTDAVCGYETCVPTDPNLLNIHLIAHTHDDIGWLKTVDQYYYGSNQGIQRAGVQYIITTVIDSLKRNPERKFSYAETGFLWKYWDLHDDATKQELVDLVNNGQLEIVGGGISQNDEAAAHYQSIIDNYSWGFKRLDTMFGACGQPRAGWQIDPFGHSRQTASLFAQFGFEGLFFYRLDHNDKDTRFATHTTEVLWQGSDVLGNSTQLFTSIFHDVYTWPWATCYEYDCNDDPWIDDPRSPDYNVVQKSQDFINMMESWSDVFNTNNIMVPMGGDFNFFNAEQGFINMDLLIKYVNQQQASGSRVNVMYSTPSCYAYAANQASQNQTWAVKTDDYFPYASDEHSFWTGYYTSRPTSKRFERIGHNFLQVSKQLGVTATLTQEQVAGLDDLQETLGILQHHDSITGTEKQAVTYDYARLLHLGITESEVVATNALRKVVRRDGALDAELNWQSCLLLNISQCAVSEQSERFVVAIYNPLSRPVSTYVRIPVVEGASYVILDGSGNSPVAETYPIIDSIKNIPGRDGQAQYDLVFQAEDVPPLGYKSYYINHIEQSQATKEAKTYAGASQQAKAENRHAILRSKGVKDSELLGNQTFGYYLGYAGSNNDASSRSSGAYVFRPISQTPILLEATSAVLYNGNLIQEEHVVFNDWISEVVRYYEGENYVEYNWIVGPIPVDDGYGKEVIALYQTNIESSGVYYTDTNGRELITRVRNTRATFTPDTDEPTSSNYYPVTSQIVIKDDLNELAVLIDRAEGGGSLSDGAIELMLHRRLLNDDAFGVGEALNEQAFGTGLVAVGHHYVFLGPSNDESSTSLPAQERLLAQSKLLAPWLFFTPIDTGFQEYAENYNTEFSALNRALPDNVQILTLEPWSENQVLLRLEHILEDWEDETLSVPVTVDIQSLFSTFQVVRVTETTLGGNRPLAEEQRFKWNAGISLEGASGFMVHEPVINKYTPSNDIAYGEGTIEITLTPMQIRTFIVDVQ